MAAEEVHRLADFATEMRIDLTVVGPELPLTLGLADELAGRGLAVFGPTRRAAEIEGSKVFAKLFMERHGIPTAPFAIVHDAAAARAEAARFGFPVVLKADGLAAGKGVLIAADEAGARAKASRTLFEERRFGASGDRVVVEAFLAGEEVSFMALSRRRARAAPRDRPRLQADRRRRHRPQHRRHGSPQPVGRARRPRPRPRSSRRVLRPAVAGLAAEGRPFAGVLYAGLMLTPEGPRVLEFNARFGDPEAQVLMLRLEDDLLPLLAAGAAGRFDAAPPLLPPGGRGVRRPGEPRLPRPAAPGRADPRARPRGARSPGVEVFHAGTSLLDGELVSAGGRVLSVCALAPDLAGALERAYAAVGEIDWPGKVYRHDIGGDLSAGRTLRDRDNVLKRR